jgi:alcohol dehydrogenase (cytochrome c)
MRWLILAILAVLHSTASAAKDTTAAEWPTYNNRYDGQRFSTLTAIDSRNVKDLAPICSARIAEAGAFQAGPLVIDGVLYVTGVTTTVALDGRTCAERWRANYAPEGPISVPVNRGAAFLDGRIFRGTVDGWLTALDAATGHVLWKVAVSDTAKAESLTSAPIAWHGLVFIGTSGGDMGIRGRMIAFDATTGHEVWRFNTIPSGREAGADSWPNSDTASKGGGGMWSSYTLDTSTGELFVPVGNPSPALNAASRPGKNLYTNSLVVLDAKSGALKWYYQLKSPDSVDHDLGAAPLLYSNTRGRRVVAMAGKDGYAYGVDRDTHGLLFRTPVTTIKNEGRVPTPEGIMVCPGLSGGTKWNGPAFDPARKSIFVSATDWCNLVKSAPPVYAAGKPYWGGSFEFDKTPGSATGWITALDSDSGKVRWRYHTASVTGAAVTPTAGGVLFTGDAKGNFLALDSATGKALLETPMNGALAGGIVTYAIDGRQYVAVTSGNISRSTNELAGPPTVTIMAVTDAAHPAVSQAVITPAPAMEAALKPGDVAHGKALYLQSCISCHGADGTAMAGFSLKNIGKRVDEAGLSAWIKTPKPPMPKLFPSPYGAQDVADIAAYVEGL